MDFAREQLRKHGWNEGEGLGKDQAGMTEAIKVKMKTDKKGVGHDPGEEFSFHWWDHVFNKAASKIEVSTTQDGVEIKNTGDTKVSKKKNSKTYDNKAMLYGQFIKGSTLSDGTETREVTVDENSDDEQGEVTQCLMPDQEETVFKMCGGRTAHKGARHGLKLNGKLLRIQEQEKKLLDTYTLKSDCHSSQKRVHGMENHEDRDERMLNGLNDNGRLENSKKSKKKKRKHEDDSVSNELGQEGNDGETENLESENFEMINEVDLKHNTKPKKRKKNKKRKKEEPDQVSTDSKQETDEESNNKDFKRTDGFAPSDCNLLAENSDISEKRKKKKKKKKD